MAWFFRKRQHRDATSLFVRLNSGKADEADLRTLMRWADEAPEKLDTLERLADVWDAAGETRPDPAFLFDDAPEPVQNKRFGGTTWWLAAGTLAVAATLLLAIGIGAPQNAGPAAETLSFATVRGGSRSVALADGSAVHLNGLSRLEVSFSADERRIDLLEGEAYFEVAHDKARTFIVRVADAEVRALGTAFDIEDGQSGVTVTVTRGTVSISRGALEDRFSAGTRVWLPSAGDAFTVTKLVLQDFEDAVTWRQGSLTFTGESLAVVLERINRQAEKPIEIMDDRLADLAIFGTFHDGNIAGFLAAIETLYPVRAEESHYRIALYYDETNKREPAPNAAR